MIKIIFTAFYNHLVKISKKYLNHFNCNILLYFNEDSGNIIFACNGMGILNIDLNNINLDDTNYDEDDPDTIILVRLLAWHIKFEKRKAL